MTGISVNGDGCSSVCLREGCASVTLAATSLTLPAVGLPRFFDLDGDGDLDLAGVASRRRLYRRAGTTLTEFWSEPTAYTCATGISFGDVNGDGLPGVFFADCDGPSAGYSGRSRFYEQTISGVSTAVTWQTGTAWNTGIAAADFDRDGDADVFIINQGGMPPTPTRSSMYLASGGTIAASSVWAVSHPVRNADFANVNADARLELLTCGVDACGSGGCGGAEPTRIYQLSSAGVGSQVWASDGVDQECRFGDIDGDGDQDVFAFSRTSTRGIAIYLNSLGTLATSPAHRLTGLASNERRISGGR